MGVSEVAAQALLRADCPTAAWVPLGWALLLGTPMWAALAGWSLTTLVIADGRTRDRDTHGADA